MKRRNVEWMACMVLMLFIAAGAGFAVGRGSLIQSRQVQRAIVEDAYYAVPAEVLDSAAASAMMQVLSDPMAGYLNQTQMQAFDDKLTGQQTIGLGMETARVAHGYLCDAGAGRLSGRACRTGQGDIVTAINGKRVQDGAQWPQWTEGERVVLHVLRGGVEREQVVFAQRIQPFDDVYTEQLTPDVITCACARSHRRTWRKKAIQALCALYPDCAIILDVEATWADGWTTLWTSHSNLCPKANAVDAVQSKRRHRDDRERRRRAHRPQRGGAAGWAERIGSRDPRGHLAKLRRRTRDRGSELRKGYGSKSESNFRRVWDPVYGCGVRASTQRAHSGVGVLPDESVPSAAEVPGWALSHAQDTQLQAALTHLQKNKMT